MANEAKPADLILEVKDGCINITGCRNKDECTTAIIQGQYDITATYEYLPTTNIAESLFENCPKLESVYFEGFNDSTRASIYPTSLPNNIFKNCSLLTTVKKTDSDYLQIHAIGESAFENCVSLSDTSSITGSIDSVGNLAFSGCSSLTTGITFRSIVTQLGTEAFANCTALTQINVPSMVGVGTILWDGVFKNCTSLQSAMLGPGVSRIGSGVFKGCSSLEEVTLPANCIAIPSEMFKDCINLAYIKSTSDTPETTYKKSMYILARFNSLVEIGDAAFENCKAFYHVTVPSHVSSIEANAFKGCDYLVDIWNHSQLDIKKGSADLGYIGYNALRISNVMSRCDWTADNNYFCCCIEGSNSIYIVKSFDQEPIVYLPDVVTLKNSLSGAIFSGLNINSIIINNKAFYDNTTLEQVRFSEDIVSIGKEAFKNCTELVQADIGSNIIDIQDNAFLGCFNFIRLVNMTATPPQLGENALGSNNYTTLTIDVLASNKLEYEAVDIWKNYQIFGHAYSWFNFYKYTAILKEYLKNQ